MYTRAWVRIEDEEPTDSIALCDARLGSLAPNRAGEELDICWDSEMEIPFDHDVVIEARRKSLWDDPFQSFSPWREVGSGDLYTRCIRGDTCAQYTESGLWRGFAMTVQMRIRKGHEVLALSPELQVQAPNSERAELKTELAVVDWRESVWGEPAGRFVLQLVLTDPLVGVLTTEMVRGLEACDFEVSNGTATNAEYWDSGIYEVLVQPAILGQPVTISLPAGAVQGVGEGISSSGRNNYTRYNPASNVVVKETAAPE